MKQYRGYYIDPTSAHGFKNEAEIDRFLRDLATETYKDQYHRFINNPSIEYSNFLDNLSRELVSCHGLSPEQIEQIELQVCRDAA